MEKLNKIGLDVLEYKSELLRDDHSSIVRKALVSAVTDLLSGEIIDHNIHDALRDEDLTVRDVRSLALGSHNLRKTIDELTTEYEAFREPFHAQLTQMDGVNDSSFARISSESHVEAEEFQVILSFEMSKAFISDYFEREGDYLDRMMKADGFAEKFAMLRYGALMLKFLKSQPDYDDDRKRAPIGKGVEIGATKVYFNKDEELYGVELVFHIPVASLEDAEDCEALYPLLESKIKEANEFINIRTIA